MNDLNIVIPMAGLGDRFRKKGFTVDKPLIDINGNHMIELVLDSLGLKGDFIFIINNKSKNSEKLKSVLKNKSVNCKIIEIDYITDGPASTCLLAEKYINNDKPLLITNCDQIMKWDSNNFEDFIQNTKADGVVVTYNTLTEKNSYVKLDGEGHAIEFAEKKIISEHSLNGIHYWKHGKDFINSTKSMIDKNIRVNGEFYIAPTFNEMVKLGKKILTYRIDKNNHWAVGTPEDLLLYLKDGNT